MQKIFLSTIITLFIIFAVSCSSSKHSTSKRLPGLWQVQPINIDGSNKDWPSPYPEYDDKAMLGYAVSNDKDNLYITVETGDPATQLKILREGLTVWIDKTANKEEVTAINFPIPANYSNDNKASDESSRPSSGQMQQGQGGNSSQEKRRQELEDKVSRALGDAKEYSLQGFKSCNLQFPILEKDSCGIEVSMTLDADNELVWEAKVPFKTFYYKAHIARSDKGKALSVCFETVGLKRPAGQNNGNHSNGGGFRPSIGMGGMGGMGMGMRMGGGGSHGGSRSGQNNANDIMEPAYKSTKTYKTFGIAYQE